VSRTAYFLFGTTLIVVIVALLWAVGAHEKAVNSLPNILARDFQDLLNAQLATDIHIGAIEQRVSEIKDEYPYVEELIIRKMDPSGAVITLFPYTYDLDHPEFPPERDVSFRAKTVTNNEKTPLGILYIKIDAQRSLLFNAAIIGSMVALVLVSFFGLYKITSKEKEVRKTTSLLEEKQRELIHLERLALVGQVTASLLHDLKKPVLNIKAELDAITDANLRNTVQEETDLFLQLVRELHLESFLRKDLERAEFLDMEDIITRSLRLVKYAQKNITISRQLSPDLPFLFGQRHRLIQVFSNILLNALQALEGEGNIQITADTLEQDGEKSIEIAISDNGPGIPYEILSHIFDPFFTSSKDSESTGLGLYITRTIIEEMGGTITAHSIPKHGTTFSICLPLSQEER
jgi:signal transduction histidine kinase